MQECRPYLRMVEAVLHPQKSPFPDLAGVQVSQVLLQLPRASASVPQFPPLTEEAGPGSPGLEPPMDGRRLGQSLSSCGARRCEPALSPQGASARPAEWHGAQGSPPCCAGTAPRIQ